MFDNTFPFGSQNYKQRATKIRYRQENELKMLNGGTVEGGNLIFPFKNYSP